MQRLIEGDLVRPPGFVMLYAAYFEGELDELLKILPSEKAFDAAAHQWTIGRTVRHAQSLVRSVGWYS